MSTEKGTVKVELDIFSGEPNPAWPLSEKQVEELKKKMEATSSSDQGEKPPILGYRGFIITNPGKIPSIPERTRIYAGILTATVEGKREYRKDADGIEEWFIEYAREQGYGELIDEDRKLSGLARASK